MTFLLDTDTVSFAMRGEGRVAAQLGRHSVRDVAISVISYAELLFGLDLRQAARQRAELDVLMTRLEVLPFEREAGQIYAHLSAQMHRKGTPIGIHDTMIAAHAIATKRTLVTHNGKHFSRIHGLKIADWY